MDRNTVVRLQRFSGLVALRKESVDRNILENVLNAVREKSLSARRAWIEIAAKAAKNTRDLVALRKESVDRNCVNNASKPCEFCRSPQGERG